METNLKLIPTKNRNQFLVHLNLGLETRQIGTLDISGKTFTTSRKPHHLFEATNSIGVNDVLLTDRTIPFQWIVIDYVDAEGNKHKLVTSRNYFQHYGEYLHFNKQSFEKQRFLRLSLFGIDKARDYERLRVTQQNLFSEVV